MTHRMMYDPSIDVYPSLPVDLESIVLLLASILLAVIVTADLDFFGFAMQLTALASYQVGFIYIIIVKTCFACTHF